MRKKADAQKEEKEVYLMWRSCKSGVQMNLKQSFVAMAMGEKDTGTE